MAISMDLELAAFQAARATYPNPQIFGCFFHFIKNMKKHIAGTPNALSRYRTDADFELQWKSVAAVAFVPLQRIDKAMSTLEETLPAECEFLLMW